MLLAFLPLTARSQESAGETVFNLTVVRGSGTVELVRPGNDPEPVEAPQRLAIGDRINTGEEVTAEVRLEGPLVRGQFLKLDELSSLAVVSAGREPVVRAQSGRVWFSSGLDATRLRIEVADVASIKALGTEYALEIAAAGEREGQRFSLVMIDGEAEILSPEGEPRDRMGPLEKGWLADGRWQSEPLSDDERSALLALNREIQWALYYPAILDLEDLDLEGPVTARMASSTTAYRAGNLLAALKAYREGEPARPIEVQEESAPAARSVSEDLYEAALMLGVGRVSDVEGVLQALPVDGSDAALRVADAFRVLLAAVAGSRGEGLRGREPLLATEWLAESYFQQSLAGRASPVLSGWETNHYRPKESVLDRARLAARKADEISRGNRADGSPFSFAAVRLAELEFAFGETRRAEAALAPALVAAPENARAWALKGFLLAARNRIGEATSSFERAIELDPGLGSGWLGRGLCRFRRGSVAAGLRDIQQAVAAEPNRAFYRSYLGKAYEEAGMELGRFWKRRARELGRETPRVDGLSRAATLEEKAGDQLAVGRTLDPGDPTSLLYSALLKRRQNRINAAIRDLERSITINDNRAVYRSRFLLDQDLAVRGANLARLFGDAGMSEVSVQEAAKAVGYEYGNFSAHLFLAESWNQLRDPTRFNLRFETAWFNELLLANLLAPAGTGVFSPNVSLQEYSRLFEQNRLGLTSSTEVRSDQDLRQVASQFGLFGKTSYSLDLEFHDKEGFRPNNDLTRIDWYTQIKQQITPADSLFLFFKYADYESGDNFFHYDPDQFSSTFRFIEKQDPLSLVGYHHEWKPGVHTLVTGARLVNDQTITQGDRIQWLVERDDAVTPPYDVDLMRFDGLEYQSAFETYSADVSQIFELPWQTFVLGTRLQGGEFDTRNQYVGTDGFPPDFYADSALLARYREDFNRYNAYLYHSIDPTDGLTFTYGVAYDWLQYPVNYKLPPLTPGTERVEKWSPKVALRYNLVRPLTVRAVYAQALGGVNFDESFRLEPTQLAGFNQAYRSIISESEVGPVAAPEFEVMGVALDLKTDWEFYVIAQFVQRNARVNQQLGVFEQSLFDPPPNVVASSTQELFDYTEHAFTLTANKLIQEHWSVGVRYRLMDAELDRRYPELSQSVNDPSRVESSLLHNLRFFTVFNHPSGFVCGADVDWYNQNNDGYAAAPFSSARGSDSFVHVNCYAGYRMLQRRLEITAGILNLTDQDYRLNALTVFTELPRERTFFARLKFTF